MIDPLLVSLLQDYVDECLPLAQQVGAAVLELESAWEGGNADDSSEEVHQQLRQIKSALHTIKGGSAMLGLGPIESLAHGLEDVCAAVTDQPDRRGPREVELLLEGADLLIGLIQRSVQGEVDSAPTQVVHAPRDRGVDRSSQPPAAQRGQRPGRGGQDQGQPRPAATTPRRSGSTTARWTS